MLRQPAHGYSNRRDFGDNAGMCLVGIAWCSHPQHSLLIAANRDEMHSRPSAAADWWPDAPHSYGGRDQQAQGTWLAVTSDGRFAAVTNVFGSALIDGSFESRGQLITDYLNGDQEPARFLEKLAGKHAAYRPFRLAIGSRDEFFIANADGSSEFEFHSPGIGVHAITNAPNGERWPKGDWLHEQLTQALTSQAIDHAQLIDALATERTPQATDADMRGDSAFQFAPFIRNDTYGTRASTVVTITQSGRISFTEHRFNNAGKKVGQSNAEFNQQGKSQP